MSRKKTKENKRYFTNLFPFVMAAITFLVTAALVVTGGLVVRNFTLAVYNTAPQRFIAPRTVENEEATIEAREAAKNAVEPILVLDIAGAMAQIYNFFITVNQQRDNFGNFITMERDVFGIQVSPELINMSEATFNAFRSAVQQVTERVFINNAFDINAIDLYDEFGNLVQAALAERILTTVFDSNTNYDLAAEAAARELAAYAVEMIYVHQGQIIIDEGELITNDILLLLEEFGFANSPLRAVIMYVGLVALAGLFVAAMSAYVWVYHKDLFNGRKKLIMLFVIYTLTLIIARSMAPVSFYLVPLLLFAVLTALLLETRLSVVLTVVLTLVASLVYGGGYEFMVYFLTTGLTVCLFSKYTSERSRMFQIAGGFGVVSALTAIALHFVNRGALADLPLNLVFAFVMPVIIVIFAVGSLPFWEAVFGITTPNKLLELIGPDKPLMRKLASEAPGTYHHSLIVANLAETAALEIGANHVLARVGAHYHDIGKLRHPRYYSENITGKNPHDDMEPLASAEIIFEHVENGLKLAIQHKIPLVIREFIQQHHGNTLMAFFYNKAKSIDPEVNESDFRYPHSTPNSKEIAIVMLADTCEAAVRSMAPSGKDFTETSAFVRKLIKGKLDENQLSASGLSIKDLETISNSFIGVFKGMYHDRVKYDKDNTEKNDETVSGEQDRV